MTAAIWISEVFVLPGSFRGYDILFDYLGRERRRRTDHDSTDSRGLDFGVGEEQMTDDGGSWPGWEERTKEGGRENQESGQTEVHSAWCLCVCVCGFEERLARRPVPD